MIDKQSRIPVYCQIQDTIKKKIELKEWGPGSTIPSERKLCEMFSVSRLTVRQAIQGLVDDGYLVRKRGKGTFIQERKIEQQLVGVTSFTSLMKAQGKTPKNELLSLQRIVAPDIVKRELNLTEHSQILCIKRIRLADEIPMAIETTFLPLDYQNYSLEQNIHSSLYEFIENNLNLKIGNAKQTIEAGIAGKNEAKLLHIPVHAPLLLINKVTYLADGRPFEYVISAYAGERFKFSLDIRRA